MEFSEGLKASVSVKGILRSAWQASTTPVVLSIWIVSTVVTALAGPFGTFKTGTFPTVLIYWGLVIWLSILIGNFSRSLVAVLLSDWPISKSEWLVPLVFGLLYTPILLLCGLVILGQLAVSFFTPFQLFLIVLTVAYAVLILMRHFRRTFTLRGDSAEDPTRPRLMERLDVPCPSLIVRMTVEDHYVIVHLHDGTVRRLLMRFADAVAEMTGLEGFLTHRSHWVARQAVVGLTREGGREVLLLSEGSTVPISRTYRSVIKELDLPEVPAQDDAPEGEGS